MALLLIRSSRGSSLDLMNSMIAPGPRRMTSESVSLRSASLTMTGTCMWRMRRSSLAEVVDWGERRTGMYWDYRSEGSGCNRGRREDPHPCPLPQATKANWQKRWLWALAGEGEKSVGAAASRSDLLEQQAGIVAAEAEAVAHGVGEVAVAGLVGDVVEVASFVGVFEVDRGGDEVSVDGQGADDCLDTTGSPEEVAHLALGGADGELFGVGAVDGLESAGLG